VRKPLSNAPSLAEQTLFLTDDQRIVPNYFLHVAQGNSVANKLVRVRVQFAFVTNLLEQLCGRKNMKKQRKQKQKQKENRTKPPKVVSSPTGNLLWVESGKQMLTMRPI
jgi:hypothetical protein